MKHDEELLCWKCGNVLLGEVFPLRREEECVKCGADLHACKSCEFFNPHVSDSCDEPVAFPVNDKERANFCDYFKYSNSCFKGSSSTADSSSKARSELEILFGMSEKERVKTGNLGSSSDELNRLFGIEDS